MVVNSLNCPWADVGLGGRDLTHMPICGRLLSPYAHGIKYVLNISSTSRSLQRVDVG